MIISDSGLTNLVVGGFIRNVAQDFHFGNREIKRDAKKFMKSEWFEELTFGVGLDPNWVRRLILKKKVVWRRYYE